MERRSRKLYSERELAMFCMQISLFWKAGAPLTECFEIMAEDAASEKEMEKLKNISLDLEKGEPFYKVLEQAGCFPLYLARMAELGQKTGNLGPVMQSLSEYYEKEDRMIKNIWSAISYPMMMITMLLVILLVLFTKVIPVFEQVYVLMGVRPLPVFTAGFRLGGIFAGVALVLLAIAGLTVAGAAAVADTGGDFVRLQKLKNWLKGHDKTMLAIAEQRFASVMAMAFCSGMELDEGLELAQKLVDNEKAAARIRECSRKLQEGEDFGEAMKETGLFGSFHIQMIKAGRRSGRLAEVMEDISEDYRQQAEDAMDHMAARAEPVLAAVLAVVVGLILLSVMLPLAGTLARIG